MCLQLHARTREVDKRMSELLATLGGLARPIAQRRDPMILSAIHYDQVILCIVDGEHAINLPNLGMGDDDHQGVGVWDGMGAGTVGGPTVPRPNRQLHCAARRAARCE